MFLKEIIRLILLKDIIRFILLVVVTYFFMQILTNKNKKFSIAGTIIVCCSSFVAFTAIPRCIIIGELAIICINAIIESKNKYLKALSILALAACLALYAFFDTGDIVAFRNLSYFTYVALAIWLILEKKQGIKIEKLDKIWIGLYIICSVLIWFFIAVTKDAPTMSAYQGNENGLMHLFSYGYSMFLPFANMENKYIYSSFLSIFPVSLIVAMIYLYQKEKHVKFLMPMILVIVLQSIFCMSQLNIFNYIGWKTTWNLGCVAAAVGLASIYLYMYMIANIDENIFSVKVSMRMALILLVIYFLVPRPKVFMSRGYMYAITSAVTVIYFMFINFGDKRYKKVLPWVLAIWSLVSSVPVLFL